MEVVNALGRRKSAVARVFVSEGTLDHHIFTISFSKFRFLSFKNWELFN